MTLILTKQTLKKLYEQPLEVRLLNGNFHNIEIDLKVNKKHYSLSVYYTDPKLRCFVSENRWDNVYFFYEHMHITDIPLGLEELISKMKELVKPSKEEVDHMYSEILEACKTFYGDMYGNN